MYSCNIFSGMRPTGQLHIGHYHGVIKNWINLQNKYKCFFCVADLHALTTHYKTSKTIKNNIHNMLIDWLASGINPKKSTLFIQSYIQEHSELTLLLSMNTPLNWLAKIPTHKDNKKYKKSFTYGYLGYPLLMAADILLYNSHFVPIGKDQIPHLELIRKFVRNFNNIYGYKKNFKKNINIILKKLKYKTLNIFYKLHKSYKKGNKNVIKIIYDVLSRYKSLSNIDKKYLIGYFTGKKNIFFFEPQSIITKTSKIPGTDGRKMSKSYNNTINLRENKEEIKKKIYKMKTDTSRIYKNTPGNPNKCTIWTFHKIYSSKNTKNKILKNCLSGKIGCIECKEIIIKNILTNQEIILERAQKYIDNPFLIKDILINGCDKAKIFANKMIKKIKESMNLLYLKNN